MLGRTYDDALDAGRRKSASATERFCVATGEIKPIDEMIRFVLGPQDAVVPDIKHRLPGRGIWITSTRQALQSALARNAFTRGFKRQVAPPADLVENTERLLERATLDALAMCHKAGRVAIGFAKVETALAREPVVALLHAAEAAPDGTRKLAAALARRENREAIAVFETFASAQLDLALGRSNVVHAALLAGPESEAFLARTARLCRFRTGPVSGISDAGKLATAEMPGGKTMTRGMAGGAKKRQSDWDRNG